jgi:hypothetical protein
MEHGQIRQFEINDIYELEGLLKNKGVFVEAPTDMQSALSIKNTSVSMSNWYPDTAKTTQSMQYFLNRSGKSYKVDGLVLINLHAVEELLATWDGITVPGEANKITDQTLYTRIFSIHEDFNVDKEGKSSFIKDLMNQILQELLNTHTLLDSETLNTLLTSLDAKDIQIYIKNPALQKYLTNSGWSGLILDKYASAPFDVNWNWGANKANYFVTTTKKLIVNISSEDSIVYTYEINQRNNSHTNIYPEGIYRNYMRIFVPADASIIFVKGFDNDKYTIDPSFNPNFKTVSGWVTTPLESTHTFEISYVLNKTDTTTLFPFNNKNLNITLYKHPGEEIEKYTVTILYPLEWTGEGEDSIWEIESGQMQTEFEMTKDTNITVSFQ